MRIRTTLLVAAGGYAAYRFAVRPWWESWGVDPVEAGAPLAGDDLVPAPDHVETRGIDIAAPPEAVWPWLVQMGYGRGGWYSYDRIDMEGGSARSIRPELQALALGDVMPTHPDGGFLVRAIEPGRALVLYVDDEIIETQAKAAKAHGTGAEPVNLRASGAFISTATGPRFVASWAFVLEPRAGGSRLIERFRIAVPDARTPGRLVAPAVGIGVFLMMRRQLLGLRERAEGASGSLAARETPATPEPLAGRESGASLTSAPTGEPETVAAPAEEALVATPA